MKVPEYYDLSEKLSLFIWDFSLVYWQFCLVCQTILIYNKRIRYFATENFKTDRVIKQKSWKWSKLRFWQFLKYLYWWRPVIPSNKQKKRKQKRCWIRCLCIHTEPLNITIQLTIRSHFIIFACNLHKRIRKIQNKIQNNEGPTPNKVICSTR